MLYISLVTLLIAVSSATGWSIHAPVRVVKPPSNTESPTKKTAKRQYIECGDGVASFKGSEVEDVVRANAGKGAEGNTGMEQLPTVKIETRQRSVCKSRRPRVIAVLGVTNGFSSASSYSELLVFASDVEAASATAVEIIGDCKKRPFIARAGNVVEETIGGGFAGADYGLFTKALAKRSATTFVPVCKSHSDWESNNGTMLGK